MANNAGVTNGVTDGCNHAIEDTAIETAVLNTLEPRIAEDGRTPNNTTLNSREQPLTNAPQLNTA